MASAGLKRRVKEVVVRALDLEVEPGEIADDEALFGDGLEADSMVALQLVFAMEEEFGIAIEDDELRVELFASVETLAGCVAAKGGAEDQ